MQFCEIIFHFPKQISNDHLNDEMHVNFYLKFKANSESE